VTFIKKKNANKGKKAKKKMKKFTDKKKKCHLLFDDSEED